MQFVDMGSEHTKFVELEVYPGARSSGKAFKTPAAVLNCIHILSATHQSERGAPAHRQSFARSVRVRATSDHVGPAAASQAPAAAAAKSSERGPRVHEIAADHRHTWLPYTALGCRPGLQRQRPPWLNCVAASVVTHGDNACHPALTYKQFSSL